MKTTTTTVSLLALALLAIGCNEQVAPELKNGNSSTTVPTVIPPKEYYFKLTNTSDADLNYNLHRTGSGRSTTPCEIKNTIGMSNDLYRSESLTPHDSKQFDVSCYLDAEELALYYSGVNYKLDVSANTCEYVGYSPFSFYDYMPGDSSTTYTAINCDENTNNLDAHGQGTPSHDPDLSGPLTTSQSNCGTMVDTGISNTALRKAFVAPESDEELCRFNYEDGPQCDIGSITINSMDITSIIDETTGTKTTTTKWTQRKVKCGGAAANCIAGAIKQESKLANKTWGTVVEKTTTNAPYSLPKVIPSMFEDDRLSNREYVNFRRDLASTQLRISDDLDSSGTWNYTDYIAAFSDPFNNKNFEPSLIDYYSANLRMSGLPLITPSDITNESIKNGYTAKPLAAEPFLGIGEANRTSPFYSFYCLDRAMDVKARIRMYVRDWDRVFPTGASNEYISDLHLGTNARQDVPIGVEIPGDQDSWYNEFNDRHDWDDLIPMERTTGAYSSGATIWRPAPDVGFPNGFFNPARFTNGNY